MGCDSCSVAAQVVGYNLLLFSDLPGPEFLLEPDGQQGAQLPHAWWCAHTSLSCPHALCTTSWNTPSGFVLGCPFQVYCAHAYRSDSWLWVDGLLLPQFETSDNCYYFVCVLPAVCFLLVSVILWIVSHRVGALMLVGQISGLKSCLHRYRLGGFPGGSNGKRICLQCRRSRYSILAWRIPWTQEPGWLQSMGSQRVGHSSVNFISLQTFIGKVPFLSPHILV